MFIQTSRSSFQHKYIGVGYIYITVFPQRVKCLLFDTKTEGDALWNLSLSNWIQKKSVVYGYVQLESNTVCRVY